jgi:hypothetical protein
MTYILSRGETVSLNELARVRRPLIIESNTEKMRRNDLDALYILLKLKGVK